MRIDIRISGFVLVVAALLGAAWWYAGDAFLRWTGAPVVETAVGSAGAPVVMRTPGGLLEISRVKAYERFSRSDTLFFGPISMGTTVSEVEVPALFRYHIELAKEWPMSCNAMACTVRTGPVKPTLPAAIYTDEMKKRTESGWARFNKYENLALLEQSITPLLAKRASDARNRDLALREGRKTVEEFVKTWLVKERSFQRDPSFRVVVLYPGESAPGQATGAGSDAGH